VADDIEIAWSPPKLHLVRLMRDEVGLVDGLGRGALRCPAMIRPRERRLSNPLLPHGLLTPRAAPGANLVAVAVTASTTPAMYLAVLYVQQTLGLPPGEGAFYFPALNLAVILGSLVAPGVLRVDGQFCVPARSEP
jgi:hypothetical protein